MKKRVLVLVLALVVFSLLAGCDNSKDEVKTWKVNKSTGLYKSAEIDSEMIKSLSVGTKVRDVLKNDHLSVCKIIKDPIVSDIRLCQVTVVGTGENGWVIAKWLD